MKGLYMISGVESTTTSSIKEFYNNNKLLSWTLISAVTYAAYKVFNPKKNNKK